MTGFERRELLKRHNDWLLAHPWWARGIVLWLVLATMVLAELVRYGLDSLARSLQ